MIVTVTCVQVKKGKFNAEGRDIDYNNVMIHCLKPDIDEIDGDNFTYGRLPLSLKIKNVASRVQSIFGTIPTADDLRSMKDSDYEVYFDEKGNLCRILDLPITSKAKKEA